MRKLQNLRTALLASPLGIAPEGLSVYAEKGQVESFAAEANDDYKLIYTGVLLLDSYGDDPDKLFWFVVRWMARNEPDHTEDAINFEADLIDNNAADVAISLRLSESVAVTHNASGTTLTHRDDPNLNPVYLPAVDWALFLGDLPEPVATWEQQAFPQG